MAKVKKKEVLTLEKKLEHALVPIDEQPYEVPKNWCWVRFENIMHNCDYIRIPLSIKERSTLEKIYDYYGASGVIDKVDRYLFDGTRLLIGEDGANLLSRSTPIAFLATGKYWVNNHAHVLDSKSITTNEFVCNYINSIDLAPFVTGSAQPKLTQDKMNSIPVPIPPLAEQQRIVEKIESLFTKLDEAKEKAESVLESFDKRKAALYNMAFSGELTEQWRKSNCIDKDTWISTTMGDISALITKGASPRWQGVEYIDDKTQTLFVTSENVREGYLDLSKEKYLNNKINEIQKRSVLHYGDVLVNIVGASIGRAAIYNLEKLANTNQAVCIVRLKNMEINDFVCFYLNSPTAQQYYCDNKVETARANISLANISSMPIMIPTEPERREIMHELKYLFEKEDASKEVVSNLIDSIELMKKSILAKAFRGELGTNNSDDESAVELLKFIIEQEE